MNCVVNPVMSVTKQCWRNEHARYNIGHFISGLAELAEVLLFATGIYTLE